jgi:peptidoglycan/LPS O-acetylase OafA/YrhL
VKSTGAAEPAALRPSVYFENLNAIRFIAALLVIVHHVEQFLDLLQLPNRFQSPAIQLIGRLGVVMFFVLSGFLISYLLFEEREVTRTISIANFYMRRILRIWPLYFLTVLLAFLCPLFPALTFSNYPGAVVWSRLGEKILLFVFFLPNLVLVKIGIVPFASHTWSIGAEEQFYLVWPLLNKTIRNPIRAAAGTIIFYLAVKWFLDALPTNGFTATAAGFWYSSPLACMALGGLFAAIVYDRIRFAWVQPWLFSRALQWPVFVAMVVMIWRGVRFPFHLEFYGVMFGIMISNLAVNPRRIFSLENRVLSYLGKISYGLYMFHPIVIMVCIRVLQSFGNVRKQILYPAVLCTVIGVASLSYEYYEKRFIRRKLRYSRVVSGDNAKRENPGRRMEAVANRA